MPELKVLGNGHLKLDYCEWKGFFAKVGCPILPGGPEASGREGRGACGPFLCESSGQIMCE